MKKIDINQITKLEDYREKRMEWRTRILRIKEPRRILVGPYLNFLFENYDTMLYQVQEMIFAEGLTNNENIQHEIMTYNTMIPDTYQLKATLLIEFDNPEIRKVKLNELIGLEKNITIVIDRKHKIVAEYDSSQVASEKLSSVQFITFNIGKELSENFLHSDIIEIQINHPACTYSLPLNQEQMTALRADMIAKE